MVNSDKITSPVPRMPGNRPTALKPILDVYDLPETGCQENEMAVKNNMKTRQIIYAEASLR